MIVINYIDEQRFSFNGIEYFKNFTPIVIGNKVRILNAYDSTIELTDAPRLFSEFNLNGITYLNVADLQSGLLPILYTRSTLGSGGGGGGGGAVDSVNGQTGIVVLNALDVDALDNDITTYPTATLPLAYTDKLLISQSGVFKEVEKSELDKQNYFTFSANTTLTNAHHNATIYVSTICNITIPAGLRSDFNAAFRTFTGVTATFLVSGTVINTESDGSILAGKSMAYLSVFSINNYIISGELI